MENLDALDYAVWKTTYGGLVRENAMGGYTFLESPDCPGYPIGSAMPDHWEIFPANTRAHDEMSKVGLARELNLTFTVTGP